MAAHWIEAQNHCVFDASGGILNVPKIDLMTCTLPNHSVSVHDVIHQLPLYRGSRWIEWESSLKRCVHNYSREEIFFQTLLKPLWAVWKPVFEREGQNIALHQDLFFKRVIEEYEKAFLS